MDNMNFTFEKKSSFWLWILMVSNSTSRKKAELVKLDIFSKVKHYEWGGLISSCAELIDSDQGFKISNLSSWNWHLQQLWYRYNIYLFQQGKASFQVILCVKHVNTWND